MTQTLDILDRLVAFETVSANSNLPLIAYAQDLLSSAGFRTTRLPAPCGTKAGLYAEIGPQVAGGLLLSAHTDVVPVLGQNWTRPAFRLTQDGDKLYGRGTTDMKGFLAAALSIALGADSTQLTRPLAILLSYDEEIGCVGLQQMRAQLAPLMRAPALCIVGEPTEMQVATGHKGKAAYRATFRGQAGHSALAPQYDNALHLAADFMAKLRAMQADFAENGPFDADYDVPFATVHVGQMSGGTALNIVPDHAKMLFEIRYLAQQDAAAIDDHLDAIAAQIDPQRAKITLSKSNAYPGLDVPSNHPCVAQLTRLTNAHPTKVAFGTEAGILAQMGVPALVCGPGSMSGQGHKADEFITTGQLAACDQMLADLIKTLT